AHQRELPLPLGHAHDRHRLGRRHVVARREVRLLAVAKEPPERLRRRGDQVASAHGCWLNGIWGSPIADPVARIDLLGSAGKCPAAAGEPRIARDPIRVTGTGAGGRSTSTSRIIDYRKNLLLAFATRSSYIPASLAPPGWRKEGCKPRAQCVAGTRRCE